MLVPSRREDEMTQTEAATGTAAAQGPLWSERADLWVRHQEPHQDPLYAAALDALGVGPGSALLDVGCGAGRALRAAADRGADVAGLDAAEAFVAHARRRVPGSRIVGGEMEALPFADGEFDVVTSFNAFQYAARPAAAIAEAHRVLRPGGRVLMAVWGPADQCDAAHHLAAVGRLLPPPPPGTPGPFALSAPGAVAALLAEGGFEPAGEAAVDTPWRYADRDAALCGLRASGPVARAIAHAGADAVEAALEQSIAPFAQADGSYLLRNVFVYAIGRRG
jgi:SAM-dependent methyltransferase